MRADRPRSGTGCGTDVVVNRRLIDQVSSAAGQGSGQNRLTALVGKYARPDQSLPSQLVKPCGKCLPRCPLITRESCGSELPEEPSLDFRRIPVTCLGGAATFGVGRSHRRRASTGRSRPDAPARRHRDRAKGKAVPDLIRARPLPVSHCCTIVAAAASANAAGCFRRQANPLPA